MNDPRDEYMSAEEQARIYRERERALNEADECVPFDLTLPPDVDPVIPAETCADDEEILIEEFLDPNPVPDVDDPSDLLPEPIAVLSRAISQSCPGGQVALAGVSPNVVVAGADVRVVYLDELSGIAQPELFRLAAYIDELQGHTTTSLIAAIDLGNFTAFDLGIVTITNTSPRHCYVDTWGSGGRAEPGGPDCGGNRFSRTGVRLVQPAAMGRVPGRSARIRDVIVRSRGRGEILHRRRPVLVHDQSG